MPLPTPEGPPTHYDAISSLFVPCAASYPGGKAFLSACTGLCRHAPVIKPSATALHFDASASPLDVPLGAPAVVLVAVILAFSAQTWINSLLGGDQGLGAFLSDGSGFNKSGFKPRKRPITDERGVAGDPTKPLDPLPWLKLPELDFVDVAGQPKRSKPQQQPMEEDMPPSSARRNDNEVTAKLEMLRAQMKTEVEQGNLEYAKRIEDEMLQLMKEEGFDFNP